MDGCEPPSSYGDHWAGVYDEEHAFLDPTAAVDALAELSGAGPALELGIGTGRVAIPLRRRGVDVHGIEASEAMVARLRRKLGGEELPVTVGDMADVVADVGYALVFAVFNTFFSLQDQARQVDCFVSVSRALKPAGVFVLECAVPDRPAVARGLRVWDVTADVVRVEAAVHDPVQQRVVSHHLVVRAEATQLLPVTYRYVWPSELDLMARLAGLRLRERWATWRAHPFTASSRSHVSIYERP